MNPFRRFVAWWLLVFLALVPATWAQNRPRIGYVYPAGGRQGTSFQVTIGGQFLDGVTNAFVSGGGVQATVVNYVKPLTQMQLNMLREKLKELQDKRQAAAANAGIRLEAGAPPVFTNKVWTAEDQRMLVEIREKLATRLKRQVNPAIAEMVTLQVVMAPDAEPGERELRLQTLLGLSNPLLFCADKPPEFTRQESKNNTNQTDMRISLPALVNGQIMPGTVDRFRFEARLGQRLVIAARARELIPYLPDAVPGWFQATLTLYDGKGTELAFADSFRFHPDPLLYYEVPVGGEYTLEIKDALYRGREDFVYRISIGELPFVTSIFPLGGQAGTQTSVEVTGWNLPVDKLPQDCTDRKAGVYPLIVRAGATLSNHVPFAVDILPECLEKEPNNEPGNAQPVTLPLIINGRVDQVGDWDIFRFEGRAGEEIVAEVYARRLDSPLDSVLKLTDSSGRQLAFNDDHEDKGAGLDTHHADSWLTATLPANGFYYLHLGDAQHKGGSDYGYRLRISQPRPDFELRIVPSSISVRSGATVPITVYALRKDGFTGEISLALKGAPKGFTLSGGWVPDHQDKVRLTLTAPMTPLKEPLKLSLEGRAMIQGQEVFHQGIPAEDMMQAFIYRHLVPAKNLLATVTGRWAPRDSMKVAVESPVKIPAGGTTRVRLATPGNGFADRFLFELSEPPEGITLRSVFPARQGADIVLACDAEKAKPGLKGNLIVSYSMGQTAAGTNATKAPRNNRRISLGALPAIPFEIIGR